MDISSLIRFTVLGGMHTVCNTINFIHIHANTSSAVTGEKKTDCELDILRGDQISLGVFGNNPDKTYLY